MRQNKPILHGGDHQCGGADPIPGYCALIETVRTLASRPDGGGGDYQSVQGDVFTVNTAGSPVDYEITTWPRITIPVDEWNTNTSLGNGLYASWSAQELGMHTSTDRVDLFLGGVSNLEHIITTTDAAADDGWVSLAEAGVILTPGTGTSVSSDQQLYMRLQSESPFDVSVRHGLLRVWWIADGETPTSGTPWPGSYPITNADVAANAAIDPVKLDHPGGTTQFLRADGTWAAAGGGTPSGPAGGVLAGTYPNPGFAADMATQAELDAVAATIHAPITDTQVWMPLFDLDGALILDGDGGLIPTLIPIA